MNEKTYRKLIRFITIPTSLESTTDNNKITIYFTDGTCCKLYHEQDFIEFWDRDNILKGIFNCKGE